MTEETEKTVPLVIYSDEKHQEELQEKSQKELNELIEGIYAHLDNKGEQT